MKQKRQLHLQAVKLLGFALLLSPSFTAVAARNAVGEASEVAQAVEAAGVVKGIVKDADGEPIIGATIRVKGASTGTVSQLDGSFALPLPAAKNTTTIIVVSYVGYQTVEVPFAGRPLTVTLREDIEEMDEVVVTALGIKRSQKGLGYATETVTGDMITGAMPSNWSSALAGKVAGLSLVSPGGPLSSTRITLRGDVSLNQNGNNALIVVDGVPMSSGITNTGDAYGAGDAAELPVDYGNGFADINPDDIESIQVLKGASATALYGTRAANGVIMVTTKAGRKQKKGIGVSFTSNASMDKAMHFPDYQYEFGQGLPSNVGQAGKSYDGQLYYSYGKMPDGTAGTSGTSSAYGAAFNPEMSFFQYDPELQDRAAEATPWVPYTNNRKDLFRTGYTLTNTLSLNGSGDRGSLRASFTYTKNEWILPNTGFNRFVASLAANQQVSQRLQVNFKMSYTNRKTENVPALGYNSNSISYFLIFQNPNVDLDWLRPRWRKDQEGVKQLQPYSTYIGNPFFTLYESTNPADKHSIVSSVSATVNVTRKLDVLLRSALQMSNDEREQRRPMSDVVFGNGFFKQQGVFEYETNSDVLVTYRETFSNGIKANLSVGGNLMRQHYKLLSASVNGLITPGVFKLNNGVSSPYVVSTERNKALNSVYGALALSWKNKIFLDVTGRNDWSSTLPAENRSFFYPSVSASVLMNEMCSLPKQISFWKLRASWAQVGNDTDPYKTARYFSASTFPGSATLPTTLHNASFKPEISSSFEAGTDVRFFKSRLNVDFAFYYNQTRNQIIDAPMDPTTGYSRATLNSGSVRNRGYEVQLTAIPIQTKAFKWTANFNWSKNENKILSLAAGMDENQLIGSVGTVSVIGKVGGSTGDLWGYKIARNEKGQPLIGVNGLPEQSNVLEFVGNAYPAWKAGLHNEFSYKGVKVSVLFDGQWGGIVYSQAHHKMTEQGKLAHTLNGRVKGTEFYMSESDPRVIAAAKEMKTVPLSGVYMIAPGVVEQADGTYVQNEKVVSVEAYNKEQWRRANVESNSFDASYLKLREARIEYALPAGLLKKTPFTKVSLALYGRNLAMWTSFPLFDPEAAALNGGSIVPGVEMGQLPTARNMGVNLSFSF